MLGLSVVPAALQFLGFLFLPESPRWLLQKGDTQNALLVLSRIRGGVNVDEEYESIRSSIEEEKIDAGGEIIQKPANTGNCVFQAIVIFFEWIIYIYIHLAETYPSNLEIRYIIQTYYLNLSLMNQNQNIYFIKWSCQNCKLYDNCIRWWYHFDWLIDYLLEGSVLWRILMSAPTRRALIVGCGLQMFQQLSGINTVM